MRVAAMGQRRASCRSESASARVRVCGPGDDGVDDPEENDPAHLGDTTLRENQRCGAGNTEAPPRAQPCQQAVQTADGSSGTDGAWEDSGMDRAQWNRAASAPLDVLPDLDSHSERTLVVQQRHWQSCDSLRPHARRAAVCAALGHAAEGSRSAPVLVSAMQKLAHYTRCCQRRRGREHRGGGQPGQVKKLLTRRPKAVARVNCSFSLSFGSKAAATGNAEPQLLQNSSCKRSKWEAPRLTAGVDFRSRVASRR